MTHLPGHSTIAVYETSRKPRIATLEEIDRLTAINTTMLAALEDYVDQTTRYINEYRKELPDARRARAAIAKAKGE